MAAFATALAAAAVPSVTRVVIVRFMAGVWPETTNDNTPVSTDDTAPLRVAQRRYTGIAATSFRPRDALHGDDIGFKRRVLLLFIVVTCFWYSVGNPPVWRARQVWRANLPSVKRINYERVSDGFAIEIRAATAWSNTCCEFAAIGVRRAV
jgi:hypothetical protein